MIYIIERSTLEHMQQIDIQEKKIYKEAKQSLESLFRYQENVNAKKDSLLLLILTLYSVVGQMLGMGIVVNDFIGRIKWRNILAYNPVEY